MENFLNNLKRNAIIVMIIHCVLAVMTFIGSFYIIIGTDCFYGPMGNTCELGENLVPIANFFDGGFFNKFAFIELILFVLFIIFVVVQSRRHNIITVKYVIPVMIVSCFFSTYIVKNFMREVSATVNNQWKPIIYFYPTEEMDLDVSVSNPNYILHSYPKYNDGWKIHVDTMGNIYDYNTKRNYYALYWDGYDNSKINTKEGFVVSGKDTTKFLEKKLSLIGLNDREINEFIMFWLPKLEDNKYNYIRFRTNDEINDYEKLNISIKPDTLIRVYMDYKPLDKKIDINEQHFTTIKREGFTVVEWGGRKLN